jgi:hypothetical protein
MLQIEDVVVQIVVSEHVLGTRNILLQGIHEARFVNMCRYRVVQRSNTIEMKTHVNVTFSYDFAFNIIFFHFCRYKRLHKHIRKYLFYFKYANWPL